ncbi:MAG: response regulator [Candidatus Heimdallarchaeota archaeon]|nr:response regulator [Candidatus Heimdallarchaeota archaeon]
MKLISKTKLLLVEDSENDALLIVRNLSREIPDLCFKRVDTKKDFEDLMMREKDWDLIITDKSLPQFTGPEVIEYVRKRGLPIPIICVSGTDFGDINQICLELGADAFIIKDNFEKITKTAIVLLEEYKNKSV